MPRIVVACALVVGGCSFSADYTGATVYCSDGKCPSGLECRTDLPTTPECRAPRQDAAMDVPGDVHDAPIDGRQYALTCNDPGPIAMTGGTVMGTTTGRPQGSMIAVTCNNQVMNGYDAIYKLENVGAGKQVNINLTATWTGAAAYIIQPCAATGSCVGNVFAQNGSPVNVTTIANGAPFIVVDSTLSGTNGPYTLTVTVN